MLRNNAFPVVIFVEKADIRMRFLAYFTDILSQCFFCKLQNMAFECDVAEIAHACTLSKYITMRQAYLFIKQRNLSLENIYFLYMFPLGR